MWCSWSPNCFLADKVSARGKAGRLAVGPQQHFHPVLSPAGRLRARFLRKIAFGSRLTRTDGANCSSWLKAAHLSCLAGPLQTTQEPPRDLSLQQLIELGRLDAFALRRSEPP